MSDTLILVVPQQVPEVHPFDRDDAHRDRLQTITQQILSSHASQRIIQDLIFTPSCARTAIMEDVVERMRASIAA
jgi:hypothetical protein